MGIRAVLGEFFALFSFPGFHFDVYSARLYAWKAPSSRLRRLLICRIVALATGGIQREAQMFIRDLLKNQETVSAEVHQTVLEVAEMMVNRNIGAVPVLRDGQLVGIFTERDLMSRVVVGGKDPAHTAVGNVMTEDPLSVEPKDCVET